MKKHMLKETNDMRRLMGLDLLNEEVNEEVVVNEEVNEEEKIDEMEDYGDHQERDEFDDRESEVIGVDSDIAKQRLQKEDSEGEETYNYGEDEGADHKEEEHLEDEEKMAPHDRIKAIEDHLEALKKDMGYDEDHEDRDEEGTHFAEGKKYSKVLNTLTESEYNRLRKYVSNGKKYSKILNTLTESEIKKLKEYIK